MNKFIRKCSNDKKDVMLRLIKDNTSDSSEQLWDMNSKLHSVRNYVEDSNHRLYNIDKQLQRETLVPMLEYALNRQAARDRSRKQEAIMGVGLGTTVGAVGGSLIDRRNRLRGLLVGGLLGGLATYALGNTVDYFTS